MLFIIYTNNFCATQSGCHIIKYADDTVVLGNISNNDEEPYRKEIENVIQWCQDNFLVLNVTKTKEMIVDFRQQAICRYPIFINSEIVEIVETYKYLGIIIDDKLKWDRNTDLLLYVIKVFKGCTFYRN